MHYTRVDGVPLRQAHLYFIRIWCNVLIKLITPSSPIRCVSCDNVGSNVSTQPCIQSTMYLYAHKAHHPNILLMGENGTFFETYYRVHGSSFIFFPAFFPFRFLFFLFFYSFTFRLARRQWVDFSVVDATVMNSQRSGTF